MGDTPRFYLFSGVITMAVLFTVAALHLISWFPIGVSTSVVRHLMSDNWIYYRIFLMPTEWIFYTWVVVYALQFLWITCALLSLFKDSYGKSIVKQERPIKSVVFYLFILALSATYGWVILLDTRYVGTYAVLGSMTATVLLTVALGVALQGNDQYGMEMYHLNYHKVPTASTLFVTQNAIGVYTVWSTCLTAVGITQVLLLHDMMTVKYAEYTFLSLLLCHTLICSFADVFIAGQLGRAVILPYAVFAVVASTFIFVDRKDGILSPTPDVIQVALSAFVFVLAITVFIAKIWLRLRCGWIGCSDTSSTSPITDHEEYGAVQYKEDLYLESEYKPVELSAKDKLSEYTVLTNAFTHSM